VGLERDDHGLAADFSSVRYGRVDDRSVAQVDTVEHTHRQRQGRIDPSKVGDVVVGLHVLYRLGTA